MAGLPFLARQIPEFATHARQVSRRRRSQGPLLPGWEWTYEVFHSLFRERFSDTELPLPTIRARFDTLGALSVDLPRVKLQRVDADGVPCTWFSVPRPRATTIFYLHGGGYVFGSARSHAPLIARLARLSRARVLAVDYRLAPEHPCPAALDDAITAWRWLVRQAGVNTRDTIFMGDSAGGGLALTTMLGVRERELPLPGRAVLLSPWTDLTLSGESLLRARHDYLPELEHFRTYAAHYHGDLDATDPRVSPLHAPDLTGLPPVLTLAGAEEAILDDATRMHERLVDAKVDATLHVEPHEVHVYPMFASLSRRGREGIHRILRFIDA